MTIQAPAKVNIFLKITGLRGNYHELRSRFVRVDSLYDTLSFTEKERPDKNFELESSVPLPKENTVAKAYRLLKETAPSIEKFFERHRVTLEKRIPQGAGLGGGSSDAAAFLNLCNELCGLKLSKTQLAAIGEKIGADVPFFVYGYPSANVEGIGEIIVPFEEELPKLKLFTPPIHCDTGLVYRTFRENFAKDIDKDAAKEWMSIESGELLKSLDPVEANDLYKAALLLYPSLKSYQAPHRFFSGSGSTFFSS
ncbi:4-(cytidine 5'-diphospho)-2-C-methyl-D-erythritol kinase [Hydrogenimonas cancrithermarum]|uniref:4-diphosphocytidyl-2-C-methyl-D-erythritol kinase n=1 Tax=Hydrogenimonas cancrithermarum TaxID=2993563 RepID=A0ABM8FLY4_9BACT|nr:4-(cytidine 5'-diphospho)-2-C-methyl-D-erythritol kinase [Hydrogenimonas cancrithermarum]BDY13369.1 4-diphosphocytidyl-2-C-methyl-D-erythritol kinase [Hydrogenimonas cancrithermarum]